MLLARFSYDAFVGEADRQQLARDLSGELTLRLRAAADPAKEVLRLIDELRALGHDLWSFDESTDFQLWCGDWVAPKQPYELVLEFGYRDGEQPFVAAAFQPRRSSGASD
jgi:hypothetical protein